MVTIRRWYVFLVCAVSLQAVTWALIALLRSLLTSGSRSALEATALQSAIVVTGLPLFLVHWFWAQRVAGRGVEERASLLRRLYLYGTLAAFLGPFIANALDLITTLLRLALGADHGAFPRGLSPTDTTVRALAAMVVLALLWLYHWRILMADTQATPATGGAAVLRRLYVLGFSAAGMTLAAIAVYRLLRWIMFQFGPGAALSGLDNVGLANEMARLLVGLPVWVFHWLWAQRLFALPHEAERASILRKLYLYLTVFVAVLVGVTNTTFILAGFLRRLLDLPSMGDVRNPLSVAIAMALLWAYHAYVLRGDAALAGGAPRQAVVRRLYLYLVAAVGLAAFLVGLSGDVSVLIRSLARAPFGTTLREQLAWFTAALIAGLPTWILPWWQAQAAAVALGPAGARERRSVVRRIYLFLYLFAATMTVLTSVVYVVYRLLSLVLGERGPDNLLSDLGQAIAFSLIAVGVWAYHGSVLRGDGRLIQREQAMRLAGVRVAVLDVGKGELGCKVLDGLRRELPDLSLDPFGLTPAAAAAMGAGADEDSGNGAAGRLASAGLIVGPWVIAVAGGAGGAVTAEIAGAVVASPARKVLIPIPVEGWDWAGVNRSSTEGNARLAIRAVKRALASEDR